MERVGSSISMSSNRNATTASRITGRFSTIIVIEYRGHRSGRRHYYTNVMVDVLNDRIKIDTDAACINNNTQENAAADFLLNLPIADILGSHILQPSAKNSYLSGIMPVQETVADDDHDDYDYKPTSSSPSPNNNPLTSSTCFSNICSSILLLTHLFSPPPACVYLALIAYRLNQSPSAGRSPRKLVYVFVFDNHANDMRQNVRDAEQWQSAVLQAAHVQMQSKFPVINDNVDRFHDTLNNYETNNGKQKTFLVFINPFSGSGSALRLFQRDAVPVFREALVNCRIVLTEHANQAYTMVQSMDLSAFDAIVIVSGDGLIFEVINGIMKRADADQIISTIPIGHIPGGSGNGLAANVEYRATRQPPKSMPVMHCAVMLARCHSIPMDLFRAELCDSTIVYGFLSLSFGLLADIDIESEKFRFAGGTRFTIYALYRVMSLKRYRAVVSFIPASTDAETDVAVMPEDMPPLSQSTLPSTWQTIPYDDFHIVLVCCVSHLSNTIHAAPGAELDDGFLHLYALRRTAPRSVVAKFLYSLETGDHVSCSEKYLFRTTATAVRIVPLEDNSHIVVDGERVKFGPIQIQVMPRKARVVAYQQPPLSLVK